MTPLFENGFTSKRGRRWGGVGCLVLQISSDGNDRMGAKPKPGILEYAGTITNLQILKTPKNSYLNQAT